MVFMLALAIKVICMLGVQTVLIWKRAITVTVTFSSALAWDVWGLFEY